MRINLSFIIPCYNVSNYIGLCLDSILSCSVPKNEYEIICVDDCSTDNTYEILLHYSKSSSILQIIQHTSNLGLGASRNDGIYSAKGKYIWFVDADDTVQTNSVETLLQKALRSKVDVLCFNYSDMDNRGGRFGSPRVFSDSVINTGLAFTYDTFGKKFINHLGYTWRFLSRKDYIIDNKIFFPQGVNFEDTVWVPKLLLLANKVQGCDIIGYNYWHHESSIMGTFTLNPSAKKIFDWSLATGQQLYEFSEELRFLGTPYFEYSGIIKAYAISRYVNFLPILLGRTSPREIKSFYKLEQFQNNAFEKKFNKVLSNANIMTKLLLSRPFGRWAAIICSFCYKTTHKHFCH